LSTVNDLLTYGSAMLNSYHNRIGGFLKSATVSSMWNYKPSVAEDPVDITVAGHKYSHVPYTYTLGWMRIDFPVKSKDASLSKLMLLYHIGSLVTTNALLMVVPEKNLVISAIANTGSVNISEHLPDLGANVY